MYVNVLLYILTYAHIILFIKKSYSIVYNDGSEFRQHFFLLGKVKYVVTPWFFYIIEYIKLKFFICIFSYKILARIRKRETMFFLTKFQYFIPTYLIILMFFIFYLKL